MAVERVTFKGKTKENPNNEKKVAIDKDKIEVSTNSGGVASSTHSYR